MARVRPGTYSHPQAKTETADHGTQMLDAVAEKNSIGQDEILTLPLSLLKVHEDNIYNIGDTEEAIAELRTNIEKNGLIHNIDVTKRPGENEYVILSGERRYKAYKYLYDSAKQSGDKEKENKFAKIPCKEIYISVKNENLRRNAEQIFLDSANVFTRDGISDPKVFEKVSVRYIQNLILVEGMSEKEAKKTLVNHLRETTGTDKRVTIERSLRIYKSLIPELYEFYSSEEADISRETAQKLIELSEESQKAVLNCLKLLSERKSVLGDNYSKLYKNLQNSVILGALEEGEDQSLAVEYSCSKVTKEINDICEAKMNEKKTSQKKYNGPEGVFEKNYDTVIKAKAMVKKLGSEAVMGALKDAHLRGSDKDVVPQLDELIGMLTFLKERIEGGE